MYNGVIFPPHPLWMCFKETVPQAHREAGKLPHASSHSELGINQPELQPCRSTECQDAGCTESMHKTRHSLKANSSKGDRDVCWRSITLASNSPTSFCKLLKEAEWQSGQHQYRSNNQLLGPQLLHTLHFQSAGSLQW